MLEKSFSILFYLKKPKGYTTGAMPVYMRITVDGTPKELTTKHECIPERWNAHAQREKGSNEASKTLNAFLDTLERKVHDARRILLENDKAITADALKAVLSGKTEKPRMLLDVFRQHNAQIAVLVNAEYAPATLVKYNTTLRHGHNFIQSTYGVQDVEVKSLSYEFVSGFEFYLKSERKWTTAHLDIYFTRLH